MSWLLYNDEKKDGREADADKGVKKENALDAKAFYNHFNLTLLHVNNQINNKTPLLAKGFVIVEFFWKDS